MASIAQQVKNTNLAAMQEQLESPRQIQSSNAVRHPTVQRLSSQCYIAEVISNCTDGGYYNVKKQLVDSTDWTTATADQFEISEPGDYSSVAIYGIDDLAKYGGTFWKSLQDNNRGNTPAEGAYWTADQLLVEMMNIPEIGTSNHNLAAGTIAVCFNVRDDEGVDRLVCWQATSVSLSLAEVVSNATGGGYYNCKNQTFDATDWNTDTNPFDETGDSFVILNLVERGTENHRLSEGNLIYYWTIVDDEGNSRCVGNESFGWDNLPFCPEE